MKFQRLKQSDIIQKGDEYYTTYGAWILIVPVFVGQRKGEIFGHYVRMRRRIVDDKEMVEELEEELGGILGD